MSIETRLESSIKSLCVEDFENALIQISIVIDAWAKKIYGIKKTGIRIKKFINENFRTISKIGTGGGVIFGSISFEQESYKGTFAEIIYKGVRCSLLHQGELAEYVGFEKFEPGTFLSLSNNKITMSSEIIWGLIFAVIGSDKQRILKMPKNAKIVFHGHTIGVAELQGNISILDEVYGPNAPKF